VYIILFVIPAPGVLSSICVVDIDVFALKNWKIKDNTGMINNGVNLNPGAEFKSIPKNKFGLNCTSLAI